MRKNRPYFVAVGGVLCALAVALMFFGSVIPIATYLVPAMASLCVLYISIEFGRGAAAAVWLVISALAVLLVPDKELALVFFCYFGYYPILKGFFEQKLPRALCFICKLLTFDASMFALYYVITRVFVIAAVRDELAEYTLPFLILLVALGNVMAIMYDVALGKITSLYMLRLRGKLAKK